MAGKDNSNLLLSLASLLLAVSCASCRLARPAGFKFGVATAAYQIEGGWNAKGKSQSIWDAYTHEHNDRIKDHSTGDVACDSYHLWQKDVELLEYLGVDFYRLSISWPRILPSGFTNYINKDGVAYYNGLIDLLLKKGIEPVVSKDKFFTGSSYFLGEDVLAVSDLLRTITNTHVTLYHWDLPQTLQDLGGWTNLQTADYFAEFANVTFALFGNRVKTWITINEPSSICVDTYEYGDGAPGFYSPGVGAYMCGKTVLLAHAKAYRLYQLHYKHTQQGKVGVTIDSIWAEPKTSEQSDEEAAEREMQMSFGWFAHPIFSSEGDYPKVMKDRILERSLQQNFPTSRLPQLSDEEIDLIRGSADFLGLNHYHTRLVSDEWYPSGVISFESDKGALLEVDPKWTNPSVVPWGLTKLLCWVGNQYGNPLVYITENGLGDDTGTLNDTERVLFIKDFVKAVYLAKQNHNINVVRYTVWSLMDNMEWTSGYTIKFGLHYVDFNNPARPRTPKESASFYKALISSDYIA